MDILMAEGLKAVPNLVIALITLGMGWIVGQRLTLNWNLRQRRRELDLSNAKEFQILYGEFFALWKLWNYFIEHREKAGLGATQWELFDRACSTEAHMEATFVRLASERDLSKTQVELLGEFRQLYQTLRQVIRDNKRLNWDHSEHPEYVRFKRLGSQVAFLIISDSGNKAEAEKRAKTLLDITSNRFESRMSQSREASAGDLTKPQ
jgi:hypothetical protein